MSERESTYATLNLSKGFTPDQYLARRRVLLEGYGLKPHDIEHNLSLVRRDLRIVADMLELPQPTRLQFGVDNLSTNEEYKQAKWE